MKLSTRRFSISKTTVLLTLFFLTGCQGPAGPTGPEGPEGPAGPEIIPTSFEFEVDLVQGNSFEYFSDIPSQIDVFDSDIMLAYVLEDYIEEDDLEVWRQLPLTDFTDNGTRVLNFDFTVVDLRLFLDADYTLGPGDEFENILIRAVHVPAGFVSANKMKIESIYNAASPDELEMILGTDIKELK